MNLTKAPRLNTFRTILSDRRWHTTAEIEDLSRALSNRNPDKYRRICAVNSTASDLRKKGFNIACRPKGRGVYEYRYVRRAA